MLPFFFLGLLFLFFFFLFSSFFFWGGFFFSSLDYSLFFFTLGGCSPFFPFSFQGGAGFFFFLRPSFFCFLGRRFFFGALGYRRPLFKKTKQTNKQTTLSPLKGNKKRKKKKKKKKRKRKKEKGKRKPCYGSTKRSIFYLVYLVFGAERAHVRGRVDLHEAWSSSS
jgi:hypothetical protein